MSFLFLFLLGAFQEEGPQTDPRLTPGEAIPLPFDVNRLAPWVADQRSRLPTNTDTAFVPAPEVGDYRSRVDLVASEPSEDALKKENQELRQRIEQLEQMMKAVVSQPPVSGAVSEEAETDKKSVPGWTVELHAWNKNGRLSNDANTTLLTENCPFTGRFAQRTRSQMHLYRFMGTFRVKESGRYVFASDLKCDRLHPCGFQFFVDKQPLMDFRDDTAGFTLSNGIPLTPGDHQLEFRTWMLKSMYAKFSPGENYSWHIKVKAPNDFTAREFEPDELFSVVPRSLNMSARRCDL